MSSQSSSEFEASLSQPSAAKPARRRPNRTMTFGGIVVIVALVVGIVAVTHHSSTNLKSLTKTAGWNSTSGNWAGYAETTAQTGQQYTSVAEEWVVPAVATTSTPGCVSDWPGIGGATSKDLIQLGTASCADSSQTGYYAWYETLPAEETVVPSLTIQPGDQVIATLQLVSGGRGGSAAAQTANYDSVVKAIQTFDPKFGSSNIIQRLRELLAEGESHLASEPWFPAVVAKLRALFSAPVPAVTPTTTPATTTAPTTPTTSGPQMWKFTFKVTSPNGSVQNWSKTVAYQSSLSSIEWINEAPTDASGVEPLPNFGTAHVLGSSGNGATPAFTPTDQIILADSHGQAAIPSAPAASDAFNTCYFPTHTVTECVAP
jgi:hypothetical protein